MCDFSRANCYGFALGLDFCAVPGSARAGPDAIDWSENSGTEVGQQRVTQLLDACIHDGLRRAVQESQRHIAVCINVYEQGLDYHFYRKEGGTWSHKLGNTGTVVRGLANPIDANAALVGTRDANGDTIIAQTFCGYLYAAQQPTIDTFQGGDESGSESDGE